MTTKILAVVTLSTSVLISCNKFKTQEQTGSNIKNLNIVSTPCMGIPERLAYVRDTLGYGNIVISQDANLKTAVLMQLTQVPDSYLKILSEAAKLPPKTYTNVNRETRTVPFQITITDTQLVGAGATYGGTYSEPFEIFLGPGDFNNSVVHELGHALHAKIFTKRYGENWQNDKSNRLTAIFEKAKQNMNIRDYGRTEENEFFAESFGTYYCVPRLLSFSDGSNGPEFEFAKLYPESLELALELQLPEPLHLDSDGDGIPNWKDDHQGQRIAEPKDPRKTAAIPCYCQMTAWVNQLNQWTSLSCGLWQMSEIGNPVQLKQTNLTAYPADNCKQTCLTEFKQDIDKTCKGQVREQPLYLAVPNGQ